MEQNKNGVENDVYDTLITKYFYFMLNMVFGSFLTPSRCCWPSFSIQRWGKEWSTMCIRVPLLMSFGEKPECVWGSCLRYLDNKILLFHAEHSFWLFFNPKQVLLTIFWYSKFRKVVVDHTSQVTLVIVFWRRIRMWWRM